MSPPPSPSPPPLTASPPSQQLKEGGLGVER